MQRVHFSTILLSVTFMLLPIISITALHHITICETLSSMSAGFFGSESILITTGSEPVSSTSLYSSLPGDSTKLAIYSDDTKNHDYTIRSIWFNCNYANFPMQSGRFFKKSDFRPDYYCAVIGKDLVGTLSNEKCVQINGVNYEVIGVLGYENDTTFDRYIFINGYTQEDVFSSNIYILDFFRCSDAEGYTETLCEKIRATGSDAMLLSHGISFSQSIIPKLLYGRWFAAIFVGNILCIILLSEEWVSQKKREMCIRRAVGAENLCVLYRLCGQYLLFVIMSFAIGYLYSALLFPNYIASLLRGYLIFLPVAILFMLITSVSVLRTSIAEVIK